MGAIIYMGLKRILPLIVFIALAFSASAQTKRKVIIDQDARGAATTDQQSILMFLQSPLRGNARHHRGQRRYVA